MDIVQKHAFRKFGCAVDNEMFLRHLLKERREEYFLDAYTLCCYGLHCSSSEMV
jgi:hypothetical protein